MKIQTYKFGELKIDGKVYKSDVILSNNAVPLIWERQNSHLLQLDDVKLILASKPTRIIIGTGFLAANSELMAKQVSWNGKRKASFDLIPEAMHVVTEGVSDIETNSLRRIVFLNSNLLSNMDQRLIDILGEQIAARIKPRSSIPTVELINKVEKRNPYWSSYICFCEAVGNQKFNNQTIQAVLNKLFIYG